MPELQVSLLGYAKKMKEENLTRDELGRFKVVYKTWSLENFNEGFINSHGRFRVRLPSHHKANPYGWVNRSHAAYEAYHPDDIVTIEYVVHHVDENKLNDSKENLEKILHGEHTRLHCLGKKKPWVNQHLKNGENVNCEHCGKEFYRAPWETSAKNFCDRKCKHDFGREKRTCPICGVEFEMIKSRKQECCSKQCASTTANKERLLNERKLF